MAVVRFVNQTPTEDERNARFRRLIEADQEDLIVPDDTFTCGICIDEIEPASGVMLRDCLHTFCRTCLRRLVENTKAAEISCPYREDDVTCTSNLQHREIKALVSEEVFQHFLNRSISLSEHRIPNSYHCKTPDCVGWCIYEDNINTWCCPVCSHHNCLTCKAVHEGMTCRDHQAQLDSEVERDEHAQNTKQLIEEMIKSGEAMRCPACGIVIHKKEGCDWVQCSMCFTEICWVTRGPRWGPAGPGDTSGGCHCMEDNETRCAPDCVNCH